MNKQLVKSKKKVRLYSFFVSMVFLLFVLMIYANNASTLKLRNVSIIENELLTMKSSMENSIRERLFYTDFLNLIITEMLTDNQEVDYQKIEVYASFIIASDPSFRNVTVAKNGVINYVFPVEGNETIYGIDLLAQVDRRDSILRAIELRKPITQGPLEAFQGGISVFNRSPIFYQDEFWGFVSVVLDFNRLIESMNMFFETDKYQYALVAKDVDTNGDFVYDPFNILDKQIMIKDVKLQGITWQLAIYPLAGWNQGVSVLYPLLIFGFILSIVLYLFLHQFFTRYYEHQRNSMFDAMTGLRNRLEFEFLLQQDKSETRKSTLIVLDIDDFKKINDTYGHQVGDLALAKLASRLNEAVREEDYVYRIGGDEFAILLYGVCGIEETEEVISRIHDHTQFELDVNHSADKTIKITTSMGAATLCHDEKKMTELFRIADDNLYVSKEKGKNTFTIS